MAERLQKQWDTDPSGEMVVKVYEETGVKARLRSLFIPTRTVDVPSGVVPHLYEPFPLNVKANQRVEVLQGDKVVMQG